MKESVLEVLMYLFENYMDDDTFLHSDPEKLKVQLSDAGFMHSQIRKAFLWLEDLAQSQADGIEFTNAAHHCTRIYNDDELAKLNIKCRGFLYYLEQIGILDFTSRELVIDRVMALESDEIQQEQLKWVILMVLFNQPGLEAAYTWVEHVVLEDLPGHIH